MKVAVFGATGPIGRRTAADFLGRGHEVRVVSRSEERLERDFGETGAERASADLMDRDAAVRAARGCHLVVHSVGLPAPRFEDHLELSANTVAACRESDARAFLVTSYWSYGPGDEEPMREDRPRTGDSRMSEIRARQEEIFLEAGGAVARLPDFFGPEEGLSVLNDALDAARNDSRVLWPGDPDAPRDFLSYVDAGRLVAELALANGAYGAPWNVPGSGARPPRELVEMGAAHAGRSVKVRGVGKWMARLAAIFRSDVREFLDVHPLYRAPMILDTSRIRELLGEDAVETTPYGTAVMQTMEWLAHG